MQNTSSQSDKADQQNWIWEKQKGVQVDKHLRKPKSFTEFWPSDTELFDDRDCAVFRDLRMLLMRRDYSIAPGMVISFLGSWMTRLRQG